MPRQLELRLCLAGAAALVLLRSAVPLLWESVFNSDQAIVGLMAKHLSEFESFPLFFYGQNYMLGVQAWIAVPFFWIGGPTVAMLRLPLVLINAGVAAGLILMFTRAGLRPFLALVATLPIITTSPAVSWALVEAIGASIEPFAYLLLLWTLRRRPLWFGALFMVAVLHREFVIFAAPAALVAQWLERRWWTPRQLLQASAASASVWLVVDVLKRTVNAYGPDGGDRMSSSLSMQAQQIWLWLSASPAPYADRLVAAAGRALPDMHGGRVYPLSEYGVGGGIDVGSPLAGAALALAIGICLARLLLGARRHTRLAAPEAFTSYLAVVGLLSLAAYGLNSGIDPRHPPVLRYLLFTLLLPIAALAAFLLREKVRSLRVAVVLLVCFWAAAMAVDTTRQLHRYIVAAPENPHREMANYLTGRRMKFGRAGYWDAYLITFLSREKVVLASTGKVRISSYQTKVDENAWHAVTLRRRPCEAALIVSAWCIDDPFARHRR
jgi:hypothetical protein